MSNELDSFAEVMIPAVEDEMKRILRLDADSGALLGMVHYHMGWRDGDFRGSEANSGKRVRPLLCLLVCSACGTDWSRAVPAAAAIEILHNFTLVHDDVQDASPTRRGRSTVWKLWGVPQAINVGDSMFALAHQALYDLTTRDVSAEIVLDASRRFDDTCVALTRGQYSDMAFELRDDVTVEEYKVMIGGKTAALLALCGELGAIVGAASDDTVAHYSAFASNLGLAFQIKDDILGIWGDESEIGKSAASDIATRKKTLPILFGLNHDESLRKLFYSEADNPDFVDHVIRRLDELGAEEYAVAEASKYSQSALEHLDAAQPEGDAGRALYQLASRLLERKN